MVLVKGMGSGYWCGSNSPFIETLVAVVEKILQIVLSMDVFFISHIWRNFTECREVRKGYMLRQGLDPLRFSYSFCLLNWKIIYCKIICPGHNIGISLNSV